MEAAEAAIAAAEAKSATSIHKYEDKIETALSKITDSVLTDVPADQKRWYAIKVFERDEKVLARLNLNESKMAEVETIVSAVEKDLDDDAESIITNARYTFITETLNGIYTKQNAGKLSVSDKIDNIVTNRWLGLPIFAVVMFIVYFVSIQTFGTGATDWVNDGLFGDGWFWFGLGRAEFDEDSGAYKADQEANQAFIDEAIEKGYISSSENDEGETEITVLKPEQLENLVVSADIHNDEGDVEETREVTYSDYEIYSAEEEPEAATYGPWQDGLPTVIGNFLKSIEVADWLQSLILNGIVAGVGAVLGFLPQMLVLFFFLAFLEGCGYMARIAFVMDRVFRKFGLSGKSFIPMLIGTGCGVPGVMASRTIENERDRRMTVMTTTFIPCSAKLPVIALIAGAFFQKSGLVATSAYFLGIAAIVISGITLKKTKMFAGDPAPFVMELPAYHWPTPSNILHSMWERGSSFVKKAGTIILLATVLVWFMQSYGFTENGFGAVEQSESMLAAIGNAIKFIFIPLGWGDWRAAVASITGLVAKENVVGTMGVLYGAGKVAENGWQIFKSMANAFNNNPVAGYSFLAFNLLCAPCFAAIGAIRREMNNGKWTWFAIAYQCSLAYVIALIIYQVGSAVTGNIHPIGLVVAIVLIAAIIWGLVRPGYKEK